MSMHTPETNRDLVQVTVVVKDSRGFTHYYEEMTTTPAAVRDAFDLMARATQPVGRTALT